MTSTSEAQLLERAQALAGRQLGSIAAEHGLSPPHTLRRAKGWVGQLLELALGAEAGSRAEPDFPALGVELKSLPIDRWGKPRESTFVTTVELDHIIDTDWEQSRVFKKLMRVLWVPVLAEPTVTVPERVVGSPVLWSPDEEQRAGLRADWEEIAERFRRDLEGPSARVGQWLQVRPKAASSRVRRVVHEADGERVVVAPRGFYLRSAFTAQLISEHLVLPQRP